MSDLAKEIAIRAVHNFSENHPDVRMNMEEWTTLSDCIIAAIEELADVADIEHDVAAETPA